MHLHLILIYIVEKILNQFIDKLNLPLKFEIDNKFQINFKFPGEIKFINKLIKKNFLL